jgi:hypothetical protein
MEFCVKSILTETEILQRGGVQPLVRYIIGDDYDLIPHELIDEEDLYLLSPTNFQQAVMA